MPTLSFETVLTGDPSTEISFKYNGPGVYILGFHRDNIFYPLYVGIATEMRKNMINHYKGTRLGFSNRHPIFDVIPKSEDDTDNMDKVYSDINLMNQIGNNNHHLLFNVVKQNFDTLIWFNDANFFNQYFSPLYVSKKSKKNEENIAEMFDPNGGHYDEMILRSKNRIDIHQRIAAHKIILNANLKYRKDNFAFTYAPMEKIASCFNSGFKKGKRPIETEESKVAHTLNCLGIYPHSKVECNACQCDVDLTKIDKYLYKSTNPLHEKYIGTELPIKFRKTAQIIISRFATEADRWKPVTEKSNARKYQLPEVVMSNKLNCSKDNYLDGYLGLYQYHSESSKEGKIILFHRAIEEVSQNFISSNENISRLTLEHATDALTRVVLAHEIGHWIHHYLTSVGCDSSYCKFFSGNQPESKEMKEAIAQYIAKHALSTDDNALALFDYILVNQKPIYRGHETLEKDGSMKGLDDMIVRLHRYRQFKEPMKTIDEFLKCTKIDPSDSIIRAQKLKGAYSV